MIEKAPSSENLMTYEEAILYCAFCRHDGYSDWRMPTRCEWVAVSGSGWYIDRYVSTYWMLHNVITPVRNAC